MVLRPRQHSIGYMGAVRDHFLHVNTACLSVCGLCAHCSAVDCNVQLDEVKLTRPAAGHLELTFAEVNADNAGNYTCTSRNTVGVDEKTALLTVQCTHALSFDLSPGPMAKMSRMGKFIVFNFINLFCF